MNTRSFIKSLALLSGAAVGCPGIFIPKLEPVRWKVRKLMMADIERACGMHEKWKPLIYEQYYVMFDLHANSFIHTWTREAMEDYMRRNCIA